MPANTVGLQLTGATSGDRVSRGAEKGILQSVSAYFAFGSVFSPALWAQIGIASQGALPTDVITILDQGYLTNMGGISWTGEIQLEPTYEIYLWAAGNFSPLVYLNYTVDLSRI